MPITNLPRYSNPKTDILATDLCAIALENIVAHEKSGSSVIMDHRSYVCSRESVKHKDCGCIVGSLVRHFEYRDVLFYDSATFPPEHPLTEHRAILPKVSPHAR